MRTEKKDLNIQPYCFCCILFYFYFHSFQFKSKIVHGFRTTSVLSLPECRQFSIKTDFRLNQDVLYGGSHTDSLK